MRYFDDYNADAGDRIMECLSAQGVEFAGQLANAADLAGQQLELLKPVVMGGGRPMYMGPAAAVKRGTILVVLANERKVATSHLLPHRYRTTVIHEFMRRAEELPVDDQERLALMKAFVEQHGSAPGGDMSPFDNQQKPGAVIGALFSGECREIFEQLDTVAVEGKFCPVAVGLIGPVPSGQPGTYCAAWPVTFPLAPYLEAVAPNLAVEPDAAD
ncbi:MAG: hypothetical protein JO007_10325 [Alphaproteobacteria bacterium]|nr:hypothetical protein [Alphaproteobacteria bacterium]